MTDLLIQVFGVYFIAAGLGLLLSPARGEQIIEEFETRPGTTYLAGAIITMLGTALVLTHQVWTGWRAILVTLIGWGAMIEGIAMLVAPKPFLRLARAMAPNAAVMRIFAGLIIVLGIAMLWGSF